MFPTQRQERILEQIRLTGGVRVADLVDALQVSDMTVRRDISALAARGLVLRVHGGATAATPRPSSAGSMTSEAKGGADDRAALAARAASLIEPGSSIAVSGGPSTLGLARALRPVAGLTVVTNSWHIADSMDASERDDRTVILTGGVKGRDDNLRGPVTVTALRDLSVDWAILGAQGLDEHAGLTVPTAEEAETDRAFMASGRRVLLLAPSSAWQIVNLCTVAPLAEVDVVVTDSRLRPAARRILTSSVREHIEADV